MTQNLKKNHNDLNDNIGAVEEKKSTFKFYPLKLLIS